MIEVHSWELFKTLVQKAKTAGIPWIVFGNERPTKNIVVLRNEQKDSPTYNAFALCCQLYTAVFTKTGELSEDSRMETLSPGFDFITVEHMSTSDGKLTLG